MALAAGMFAAGSISGLHPASAGETNTMTGYSIEDSVIATDANAEATRVVFVGIDSVTAYAARFSPGGSRLATGSGNKTARNWTPAAAGVVPDGAAGLWTYAFETEEQLPDEITRFACLTQPVVIGSQGLIVMFQQAGDNEPPDAIQTFRCTASGDCKMFPGAPGQSQEPLGEATFSLKDKKARLCNSGDCLILDRCKAIVWTEEEKSSGFAAKWDAAVLGSVKGN